MAADWQAELRRIQQNLETTSRQVGRDFFYHGVVSFQADITDEIEKVIPNLSVWGYDGLVEQCRVNLPNGRTDLLFISVEYRDDSDVQALRMFKEELRDIQRILKSVSKRVVPPINLPPQSNGLTENTLYWMYLLHSLGTRPENKAFTSHVEFLDVVDSYSSISSLRPWSESACLPHFDPTALLTFTNSPDETHVTWKAKHKEAERHLPELIASSISKPLFYASQMAIEFLLTNDSLGKRKVIDQVHSTQLDGVKIDLDMTNLFSLLMNHHKRQNGDLIVMPLSQNQIKDALSWDQTRVSRTMKKLMKLVRGFSHLAGMKAYRTLCKSPELDFKLTRLYTKIFEPRLREVTDIDPDLFSSNGFNS